MRRAMLPLVIIAAATLVLPGDGDAQSNPHPPVQARPPAAQHPRPLPDSSAARPPDAPPTGLPASAAQPTGARPAAAQPASAQPAAAASTEEPLLLEDVVTTGTAQPSAGSAERRQFLSSIQRTRLLIVASILAEMDDQGRHFRDAPHRPAVESPSHVADLLFSSVGVSLDDSGRAAMDTVLTLANAAAARAGRNGRERGAVLVATTQVAGAVAEQADGRRVVTGAAVRRGWRRVCPLYPFC